MNELDLVNGTPDPSAPAPPFDSSLAGDPNAAFTPPSNSGFGSLQGQTSPTPAPQNKWERMLMGALVGLSGASHARGFGQGLAGGAQASLQYGEQQKLDADRAAQLQMQQAQAVDQHQQAIDTHAMSEQQLIQAQANIHVLQAQYATMPKSLQDVVDQADMKAGAVLKGEGVPVVTGNSGVDFNTAQTRIMAERSADPSSMMQYVMHTRPDGKYDVFQIQNPDKTNDVPVDVTIGYDMKTNKPISKLYAPHTISTAQRLNLESNALTAYTKQQNDLNVYGREQAIQTAQAGPRAYAEEAGRNRADMEAFGTHQDAFGNPLGAPGMNLKEYTKRVDSYSKDYGKDLNQLDQAGAQMSDIIARAEKTGQLPGADSVVALFDAISISSAPLKGKGFRIGEGVIGEHRGARNALDTAALKLKNLTPEGTGQVITLKQLKDYSAILQQARHDAYVGAGDQAVTQGIGVQILPMGHDRPIDPNTANIFLTLANGDPAKATLAAQAKGWVVPPSQHQTPQPAPQPQAQPQPAPQAQPQRNPIQHLGHQLTRSFTGERD